MTLTTHQREASYPPPPPPQQQPSQPSLLQQQLLHELHQQHQQQHHQYQEQEKKESKMYITAVIIFYMIVSISMIMINKTMLDAISLPFSLLWGQLLVAVLIMIFLGIFKSLPPLEMNILPSIIPLIAMNVIGLTINTFFLKEIDAVMYQVGRSMLLPMTVILTPLILGNGIGGFWVVISCCIITSGYIIGMGIVSPSSYGYDSINNINWKGVWLGLASSLCTTIHSFVIKISFRKIKYNSTWSLLWYNNLGSLIILTPFLLYELDLLSTLSEKNYSLLLYGSLLAGSTGLLINLAGFLQLKVTSPLSHMVSSISRGVIQTLIAFFVFNDYLNEERIIGIIITLLGSSMYILAKN